MNWRRIVGGNVRRLRNDKGLTQETLAHEAGIHVTYISGIESGKRNPSLEVLVEIANSLKVPPEELLKR